MAKQALILVDIQNDYFPSGKWPLVGIEAAADQEDAVREATDDPEGNVLLFARA